MTNSPTAETLFKQAALYTDNIDYAVIHLPPAATVAGAAVLAEAAHAFSVLIVDKDEVSLVMPQNLWEDYAPRLPQHRVETGFRLITFDLPLEFDVIGFMALVSRVLAEANVSLLAISAFSRDHVLVPSKQFGTAWDALEAAQS